MSLKRDTFFDTVANWERRLVSFIVTPVTIYYFTSEQYGYMSLVNTIGNICFILGALAVVDQGLPRFYIECESDKEKTEYVSTAFVISGIGIASISVIILIAAPLAPHIFQGTENSFIFSFLVVFVCIGQAFYYVGGNLLKWSFKSKLFAIITLVQSVFGSLISIGGMFFLGWRAQGVVLSNALVNLAGGLWANASNRKYVKLSMFSKEKGMELFRYAWPFLGLNVFAFFTRSLDRIFLASMKDLGEVGIYAVASAFSGIQETAISGFFFAWGPYVLSNYREKWAPVRFAQFFGFFSWVTIVFIIFLGLWGTPIIGIIQPDGDYGNIGIYIPWIMSGTGLYYLGGYFAPGPNIVMKSYWKLIAFIMAAALNAILNFLLIPRLGPLGAGIATSISSLAAGIFHQIVSNRFYHIPNRWKTSFATIIGYVIIVSVMQTPANIKMLHLNNISIRILVTVILATSSVPLFRREIKEMKIAKRIYNRFA